MGERHLRIEQRHARDGAVLAPDPEGISLILDRLRAANTGNPDFDAQRDELVAVLRSILGALQGSFADQIHAVVAVGDWASHGIDLRNVPYFDELTLEIVLRSNDRPFELYWRLGEDVFSPAARGELAIHFSLMTRAEWRDALVPSREALSDDEAGIPLLTRE